MDETKSKQEILADLLEKVQDNEPAPLPAPASAEQTPQLRENDELFDMSDDIDFDAFQVVRREFFAHLKEPSITFNECKFFANAACLSKFPNADYAQVLVNREKQILALRPCEENARDSFQWCNNTNGKRKARAITCKIFFAKIVDLMDWNPNFKYKILGKLIHANGEYLLVFDLTATEVYQRTIKEGEKPKTSRTAIFPANWQNQFGMTFNEHKQSMHINIFAGYAVYSIKEPAKTAPASNEETNKPIAAEQQTFIV